MVLNFQSTLYFSRQSGPYNNQPMGCEAQLA